MIAQVSSMMLLAISLKCGRCGEQLASAFTTCSKNIITSRQQYYDRSPTLSSPLQSTRWRRSERRIISHSAESDVHIIVNHTEIIIAEDESLPSSSISQRETILHNNNIETSNTQPLTLPQSIDNLPRHIAFICDGNSRWAQNKKSMHKSMGHVAGADRVVQLIQTLSSLRLSDASSIQSNNIQFTTADRIKQGGEHRSKNSDIKQPTTSQRSQRNRQNRVEYCTLYAFSTENWSRPQTEISTIFKLIQHTAIQYQTHHMILDGRIQIEVLGDLDDVRIPNGMRDELNTLVHISKAACDERRRQNRGRRSGIENENDDDNNDILTICLAINYGGRSDILQAAQKLAQSIASGEVTLSNNSTLNESLISERLSTSNIPDPDLIIRTGGEQRLSNFLLWNVAYSELYFSDLSWPDFDNDALKEALSWYGKRKRRFGGRD